MSSLRFAYADLAPIDSNKLLWSVRHPLAHVPPLATPDVAHDYAIPADLSQRAHRSRYDQSFQRVAESPKGGKGLYSSRAEVFENLRVRHDGRDPAISFLGRHRRFAYSSRPT